MLFNRFSDKIFHGHQKAVKLGSVQEEIEKNPINSFVHSLNLCFSFSIFSEEKNFIFIPMMHAQTHARESKTRCALSVYEVVVTKSVACLDIDMEPENGKTTKHEKNDIIEFIIEALKPIECFVCQS